MKPLVGIIMGSSSDWETMQGAARMHSPRSECLMRVRVVSAHRTPDLLFEYAATRPQERRVHEGHYRRSGWCGSFAGNDGIQNLGSGLRRARAIQGIERHRLALVHRPDAERRPRGYLRHASARPGRQEMLRCSPPRFSPTRISNCAWPWMPSRAAQTAAVLSKPDPRHP